METSNGFTFIAGRNLLSTYRLQSLGQRGQPDCRLRRIARATSCGAHRRKNKREEKNKYFIFAAILKLKRNNDTATTAETTAAQTTTTTTTRMQAARPATQAQ